MGKPEICNAYLPAIVIHPLIKMIGNVKASVVVGCKLIVNEHYRVPVRSIFTNLGKYNSFYFIFLLLFTKMLPVLISLCENTTGESTIFKKFSNQSTSFLKQFSSSNAFIIYDTLDPI